MWKVILCDPDKKDYESTNLGMFYTALSRATTLGDDNGLNSAIYFDGTSFKPERFRYLIKSSASDNIFKLAKQRQTWVDHLHSNARKTRQRFQSTLADRDGILSWSATTFSTSLTERIQAYKQANATRKRKHNSI